MQTPAADSEESNKRIEPLEQDSSSSLWLDEPIASNASKVHDNYLDEGSIMTQRDATSRYFYKRKGDKIYTNSDNGKNKDMQWVDKKNYCWMMDLDKELADKYRNLSTALVSLRVQRGAKGRVTLLDELHKSFNDAFRNKLKYALDSSVESWEWVLVYAGTELYSSPHLHLYILADGDLSLDLFRPAVKRFARNCKYSPSNCRGNRVDDGAVSIMGNGSDSIPRRDDGVSAGMAYVAQQLAHLPAYENLDQAEAMWGATVRAWTGGTRFRRSRYDLWGDEHGYESSRFDFSVSPQCKSKVNFNLHDKGESSSSFDLSAEQSFSLSA